ncbi:hypothetical protein COU54_00600 [Candidatus Pacearchaeota archaeon CG10_big_fil_rev_8_21_14_0_10_31_24]|nr:MAG: hypothetical protein COU54_00600 [Candidatus Pacearchaeota archaeon CG10_big_fil_rev_8_21_14_0_10_31_24]
MDRKKTICLVYEFLTEQGGLEREIINHANYLKEAGYDVTILTCHLDEKLLKLLPFDGLKIKVLAKIKTDYETVSLAQCFMGLSNIDKYNPDLFLTYSFPANVLIKNKKCKKINYVNHFPHFLYLDKEEREEWASSTQGIKRKASVFIAKYFEKGLKKLDKKLLKKNRLIFMNSKFTQARLEKIYRIKSIVSYPPLDPKFKVVPGTIKEKFVFSSSRIIPDKKYDLLIEAMSYMNNKLPLYVAGTVQEDYRKKLESFASKCKVKLNFLGRLNTEQIRNYYASASVFAFPTPGEDFGLVPAESMMCGTPVVAWGDGAGPTEQIIDGVSGYLAKPLDVKDFAKKMDLILDSNMKKKNSKKIVAAGERFSYNSIKKQFLNEVEKVFIN